MFRSSGEAAKQQMESIKKLATIANELNDLPIDAEPTNVHWRPQTNKRWLKLFSVALDGFYK